MNKNNKKDLTYYLLILGLQTNFDKDELKKAYKKEAKKWHPDLNKDDINAEEKLKLINEAYEYLSSEENFKSENNNYSEQNNVNKEYSNEEEKVSKDREKNSKVFIWILKSLSFPLVFPIAFLLIASPIILSFPILEEDIKEINYCYALEKIIARNIFKKKDYPSWIKKTSKSALNFYFKISRGGTLRALYKESYPNIPPELNCLIGYYEEKLDPGIFSNTFIEAIEEEFDNIQK